MNALAHPLLAWAALLGQEAAPAERFQPTLAEHTSLELEAFWEPCRSSLYQLFEQTPVLRAPKPDEKRRRYESVDFRPFLPQKPVALGEVYEVDAEAVLSFLSQFDPGAMLRGMHDGGEVPATYAMVRAVGPDAFEILLRAHAVLQLSDQVLYKPAQYEGRLVLSRPEGSLRSFTLALPSRDTNVDVNVAYGQPAADGTYARFSADIGWVPRMELTSAVSGQPAASSPAWTRSIPDEDARLALRHAFYPFSTLDWMPFEKAVLASREQKKPLHLVLLFGCLDDDSC